MKFVLYQASWFWTFTVHTEHIVQLASHCLVRAPLGASWSDIFRVLLVLVRRGPGFLKFFGSEISDGSKFSEIRKTQIIW